MRKQTDGNMEYEAHARGYTDDYQVKDSRLFRTVAKILALLTAFFLWIYVGIMENPTYETTLSSIPVEVESESNAAGLSVLSGYGGRIDVTVQGKRSDVSALTSEDLHAYVDLSAIEQPGRYDLEIQVEAPDGITVTWRSANTMSVYMDLTSTVMVPVRAQYTEYQLQDNFELGDPKVSLSEVMVTGPVSVLETLQSAVIQLRLGTVSRSTTVVGTLALVDERGEFVNNAYVKLAQTTAKVTVPVYMTKTLPLTVKWKYGYINAETAQVDISPAVVRVRGEVSDMEALTSVILTTVDETKLTGTTLTQKIALPDGLTLLSEEDTATVRVTHTGTSTVLLNVTNFNINNPKGLAYTQITHSINVTVRGDSLSLLYLRASDMTANLDLSYLESADGTVTLPVEITIKDQLGSVLYVVGEYTAAVRIGN